MKKVLLFTYYWPPAGGVAVQRFLKFSKYLPEFGWEPIVITVQNGSYPYIDESLLQEVSPQLRVYRTATFEPFEVYNLLRGKKGKSLPVVAVGSKSAKGTFQKIAEYIRANFFVPDARKGWVPYACKQAEKILATETIDAIVTTGPPHSAHLIGLYLKQKYGIRWVADFRDPWTGIFYNALLPRTARTIAKDEAMEKQVLQTADVVTVISPGMLAYVQTTARQAAVIYNGYDEADFQHIEQHQESKSFVIRYVGNLMASQQVNALWQALSELTLQGHAISVELIGRVDAEVQQAIQKHGLTQSVRVLDFVPHHQAVRLMQTADMLLFVIPDVADNHLIMTGKLFEYLASCTELLSIGPVDGNAAHVLQQTGRKPMLHYTDVNAIRQQLTDAITHKAQHSAAFRYTTQAHQAYSRQAQAGMLAALLKSV